MNSFTLYLLLLLIISGGQPLWAQSESEGAKTESSSESLAETPEEIQSAEVEEEEEEFSLDDLDEEEGDEDFVAMPDITLTQSKTALTFILPLFILFLATYTKRNWVGTKKFKKKK